MEYKKNRKSRSACGWWVSMEMVYVQGPDTFVSMMYIWVPVQPSWDASTEWGSSRRNLYLFYVGVGYFTVSLPTKI